MRDLTLSPSLFAILSGLVEERTGIHYDLHDNDIFSGKLVARAQEAGFESALDYYYYLRYDDEDRREFDALIDTLVVNETYFFREERPLLVLRDDVQGSPSRPYRIWCAACSTGEEPLTLAMLLAERGQLKNVEIIASDISRKALSRAREGVYGQRSLRVITAAAKARWLDESGDCAVVRGEVRDAITWHRVNLLDTAGVASLGKFDAILCRNVLIYFSETTVPSVVATLASALKEGGRLVVGASESLLRFGTMLTCEEREGCFFYRKLPR